jgi:hypothetical protein
MFKNLLCLIVFFFDLLKGDGKTSPDTSAKSGGKKEYLVSVLLPQNMKAIANIYLYSISTFVSLDGNSENHLKN